MEEVIKPMEERLKAKEEEVRTMLLALNKDYKVAEKEAHKLQMELNDAKYPVQRMLRGEEPVRARGGGAGGPEPEKPKVEFHRKCMVTDCNGWLSTAWRCGVCENYTCSTCYANKGKERDATEHTCKDEDKATVALLAKDTKPCPNCGMGVQRTEGCPVMFCTACHKGFNWNTLKIMETGIHNPHYFEWRNRGGGPPAPARTMGDIPCGGLPAEMWLWALTASHKREYISNMYRTIQHITDNWFMNMYRVDGIQSLELRTKYLLGDSTKESVQTALGTQEKINELKMALWDCYNTCAVAGSELLRELFLRIEIAVPTGLRTLEHLLRRAGVEFGIQIPFEVWTQFETDAEALRLFINRSVLDVADVYRSIRNVQVIRPGWKTTTDVESQIRSDYVAKVYNNGFAVDISKKVVTGEESPLLKETGFVWYKGSIVSPDAKVLKRGAAAASGEA